MLAGFSFGAAVQAVREAASADVLQVSETKIGLLNVALALGIPGEAVMGLVGPEYVAGTAALGFLLAAERLACASGREAH